MSEGKKPPPKHWHFWRAEFWTRPALIVVYSILAGVGRLLLLSTVPGNIANDRVDIVQGDGTTAYLDHDVGLGVTYYYVVKSTTGRRDGPASEQVGVGTPVGCFF